VTHDDDICSKKDDFYHKYYFAFCCILFLYERGSCQGSVDNQEESMTEAKDGCVKPSKGPIMTGSTEVEGTSSNGKESKEVFKMLARVGKPAPDFELAAYLEGGFKNIRLSDFKGKWIILCFYPGDFTFV
jgi:hypothetical protein